MIVAFAKYKMLNNHTNFFDLTDPDIGDILILTKHVYFPLPNKQLTSPEDFSQIQYSDIEMDISLLSKERSRDGFSISDYFEELIENDTQYPVKKCICIVDSGKTRWAGFVSLPMEFDYSYANKKDGFILSLKVYDAMVEWKNGAETMVPAYFFQNNTSFVNYLANQIMNRFFLQFECLINLTEITGSPAILNKSLLVWALAGGNDNFTIYNLIKGLAMWGLVMRFEVPADYMTLLSNGRLYLTFRLMRRVEGSTAIIQMKDYYRTQLPKVDKGWVLLVNHRYDLRDTYFTQERTYDIVHGVLISESQTYNYDNYNFTAPPQGGPPDPCFILNSNVAAYQNKLTVFAGGGIVKQIELSEVKIVESEMFKLNLTTSAGQEYSLKFANSNIYLNWNATKRSNSRIAAHRLFCNTYMPEPHTWGIHDYVDVLNKLPQEELKVLLKNRGSVYGTTSIIKYEPDLFETFIVPYKGVNELHSIIRVRPDYNFKDTGSTGREAEYQTVRIG